MAESFRKLKTEHNGAKNGGGYWGPRAEAKRVSKKARRLEGKRVVLPYYVNKLPD